MAHAKHASAGSRTEVIVRPARPGDGPGCAAAWLDAGRSYAQLRIGLQEPAIEGLAEWFEPGLQVASADDELFLVAEVDGSVAGFLGAGLHPAQADARWQLQRDLAHPRLHVDALVVAEAHRRTGVGTALDGRGGRVG